MGVIRETKADDQCPERRCRASLGYSRENEKDHDLLKAVFSALCLYGTNAKRSVTLAVERLYFKETTGINGTKIFSRTFEGGLRAAVTMEEEGGPIAVFARESAASQKQIVASPIESSRISPQVSAPTAKFIDKFREIRV
ncbi:hypothetical protein EVAR_3334_1 [Eumeta japonica]|uniref:Uncharacterized protein n=1 Tax=Eumeta variegata TaxID=151549 RepID=A0A4C1SSQ0_EUMVA|nr:hypothetical protein EVAR_3334_1 [Eumeta japonica]